MRLGLQIRKLKILLMMKDIEKAFPLLKDVENMLELSLKNRQVLLYMEDENKLLTYYFHSFLDMKAEYYRQVKKEQLCIENTLASLVPVDSWQKFGEIYNEEARIKSLQRAKDVILSALTADQTPQAPAVEQPSSKQNRQPDTKERRSETAAQKRHKADSRKPPSEEEVCSKLQYPKELADSALKSIDRMINFTHNRKRRFVLMVDSSFSCLETIDSIKQSFQLVALRDAGFREVTSAGRLLDDALFQRRTAPDGREPQV